MAEVKGVLSRNAQREHRVAAARAERIDEPKADPRQFRARGGFARGGARRPAIAAGTLSMSTPLMPCTAWRKCWAGRRSRLPVACFLGGATGVGFALWFQFWTTARDWPINVGGRPWNSLPAFVPVAFECMVLVGGLRLVFAWLFRCRLYPGKDALTAAARRDRRSLCLVVREPSPERSRRSRGSCLRGLRRHGHWKSEARRNSREEPHLGQLAAVSGLRGHDGALLVRARAETCSQPNYDFLPEAQMAYSPAYDSFSPNPNFADGSTLRTPPAGTIARGHLPLHYQPTLQDALRAGRELQNPFSESDASASRPWRVSCSPTFVRSVTGRWARGMARSRKAAFRRRHRCWPTGPSR